MEETAQRMNTLPSNSSRFRVSVCTLSGVLLLVGLGAPRLPVEGISLSSLDGGKETVEDEYGPFAGVYAGSAGGEDTNLFLDYTTHKLEYDVLNSGNNFLMGFEVGYAWQTRYFVEFALSFEGMFSSSEFDAILKDTPTGNADIARAKTDLNYVTFLLNGQLTLDLERLKPRLGNFVTRFRPYVGGGIGGSQIWFRNQDIFTVGDLAGTPTDPDVNVFDVDQFVLAYQFSGGLEVRVNDRLDAYVEYRELVLEGLDEIGDFESGMVIGGLQYRY